MNDSYIESTVGYVRLKVNQVVSYIENKRAEKLEAEIAPFMRPRKCFFGLFTRKPMTREQAIKHNNDQWDHFGPDSKYYGWSAYYRAKELLLSIKDEIGDNRVMYLSIEDKQMLVHWSE